MLKKQFSAVCVEERIKSRLNEIKSLECRSYNEIIEHLLEEHEKLVEPKEYDGLSED